MATLLVVTDLFSGFVPESLRSGDPQKGRGISNHLRGGIARTLSPKQHSTQVNVWGVSGPIAYPCVTAAIAVVIAKSLATGLAPESFPPFQLISRRMYYHSPLAGFTTATTEGWHTAPAIPSYKDFVKRVIVTPAVYPRLIKSLCVDIQSTGQKSLRANTLWSHHEASFQLNSRIPRDGDSSSTIVKLLS